MRVILSISPAILVFFYMACMSPTNQDNHGNFKSAEAKLSPLLARVENLPQAFRGSDKKYHVVYELLLTNFSTDKIILSNIIIKNAQTNVEVKNLKNHDLLNRFVVFGEKDKPKNSDLEAGKSGVIYVHLFFDSMAEIPTELAQEINGKVINSDGEKAFQGQSDDVKVSHKEPIKIGPPLIAGSNYVAADGCCDSVRHVRAGLPVNGKIQYAQRFAIDYEKIGDDNKIYKNNRELKIIISTAPKPWR